MRPLGSRTQWLFLSAAAGTPFALGAAGCSGTAATVSIDADGSADASSDDTTASEGGEAGSASESGMVDDSSSAGDSASAGDGGTPGDSTTSTDSGSGGDSEAAADSASGDSASDADSASGTDAGSGGETGVTCGASPTPCVNPSSGADDFCTSASNLCGDCTDGTDDVNCAAAYGSGSLCVSGACVPGNCHTSADCTGANAGDVCGASAPNTCGPCTSDGQCQNDSTYGAADICNTAGNTGTCVSAACTAPNAACVNNPADECCAEGSGTTCVPGNCCSDAQCTGGQQCNNHSCVECTATAQNNQFYVDPENGSDNGHTGAESCPFQTLTKALSFIGAAAPMTRVLVADSRPVGSGETFPIVVPANVTILSAQPAPFTIAVPAGQIGFTLSNPSSGLNNLVVDGQSHAALTGIQIVGGSDLGTTQVQNATVKNMLDAGILVGNIQQSTVYGQATLGPGVVVSGSGVAGAIAPGLRVFGQSQVMITGGAGSGSTGHTSFRANTQHGIVVTDTAFVTIAGNAAIPATAPGMAYVDVDDNMQAGLWIAQNPATVTAAQTNVVTGLEVTGITSGNGVRILGGSFVTMTNSYILGNHDSGIDITSFGGKAANANSLAGINLGTEAAPGQNTLQGPISGQTLINKVAGLCIGIPASVPGQTLTAVGNIWGVNRNCMANVGATLTHAPTCANAIDLGGVLANGNTANVASCAAL